MTTTTATAQSEPSARASTAKLLHPGDTICGFYIERSETIDELDADAYADMTNAHIEEQPYIFIYLLRDCSELIESAAEMAAEGAHICYISERDFPISNSVNLFGVGPEEFVSLIAHADAVLTNSFHATVFSVLFHRPFRVFATDKSSSRMRDLLGKLGISELCVSHADTSPISNVGWEDVDLLLEELRASSWSYLRRALS